MVLPHLVSLSRLLGTPTAITGDALLFGRIEKVCVNPLLRSCREAMADTPPPPSCQSRHLVRMLRPELVKANSKPLSSDAFTFFGIINARQHNALCVVPVAVPQGESSPN